jgi:hypothetical protein
MYPSVHLLWHSKSYKFDSVQLNINLLLRVRTKSRTSHSPRFYCPNNSRIPRRLVTANYDAEEASVKAGGKQTSACHLLSCLFHARLTIRPWRWKRYVTPKHRFIINGLHGILSKKIVLIITTPVMMLLLPHISFSRLGLNIRLSNSSSTPSICVLFGNTKKQREHLVGKDYYEMRYEIRWSIFG